MDYRNEGLLGYWNSLSTRFKPLWTLNRRGHRKCPYQRRVCIKRVEFRENENAFSPQGQNKLSVIMRCPYVKRGLTVFNSKRFFDYRNGTAGVWTENTTPLTWLLLRRHRSSSPSSSIIRVPALLESESRNRKCCTWNPESTGCYSNKARLSLITLCGAKQSGYSEIDIAGGNELAIQALLRIWIGGLEHMGPADCESNDLTNRSCFLIEKAVNKSRFL